MIQKPGEFAPGQRYRPGMLQRLADGVRGATPVRQAGVSRHRTRLGWTQDEEEVGTGGAGIVIRAGSGGIPGRVGATPGKATNVIHEVWDGDNLVTAETITVYNVSSSAVAPFRYGVALDAEGRWVVVVESCG